jgi:hypothetical protein
MLQKFEVLMGMGIKIHNFSDVTPCALVNSNVSKKLAAFTFRIVLKGSNSNIHVILNGLPTKRHYVFAQRDEVIDLKQDIQLSEQVLKQGPSDYKDTVPAAIPHCLVHVLFQGYQNYDMICIH